MSQSNRDRSFQRSLVYLAGMAVLLLPISYLGQPAVKSSTMRADEKSAIGVLAQLREQHELSAASIGDIDPAGATMQMVLLGGNGFAINKLWNNLMEAQKTEDWDTVRLTAEQLTKLQPHFYKVWDYLAHNQSYNMSVEFDDYRARYKMVISGFNYYKQGIDVNKNEPRLPKQLGWYIGHKIGRADERRFYRKLFQNDWMKLYNHEEDNRDRTYENRDNWLVAKEKYDYAYRIADEQDLKGVKLKTTPSLFYKEYWQSQVNYAEALVASGQDYLNEEHASAEQKAKENGITDTAERNAYIAEQVRKRLDSWGEQTHAAWMLADQDISDFAMNRKFPTVNKWLVALGQQEQLEQAKQQAVKELDQLVPGGAGSLFKQLDAKAQAADPGVADLLKKPYETRSEKDNERIAAYEDATAVTWQMLADSVPEEKRTKAKQLANELRTYEEQIREIQLLRDPLNYNYWRTLIDAEKTTANLKAHEGLILAKYYSSRGRMLEAAKAYEAAFCHWREVLNDYPLLRRDSITADELYEYVKEYKKIIARDLPEDFPLSDVVLIMEQNVSAEIAPFPPKCGEKPSTKEATTKEEPAKDKAAKEEPAKPMTEIKESQPTTAPPIDNTEPKK